MADWNFTTYDPVYKPQGAGAAPFHYGPNAPTSSPTPAYGGYQGGANDAANHYAALASDASGTAAPGVNDWQAGQDRGQVSDAQLQQQQALQYLSGVAQGGQTDADRMFAQNISSAQGAQRAAAAGTRGGGANVGAAQQGAVMQNAQTAQSGAQQGGILHAQQQAAAQRALMSGQLDVGLQQLAAQQQAYAEAQARAGLQLNQNQINNAGAQGYSALGQGAELGQLGADSGTYAANIAAAQAKAQRDQAEGNSLLGAGGKMLAGAGALLFL